MRAPYDVVFVFHQCFIIVVVVDAAAVEYLSLLAATQLQASKRERGLRPYKPRQGQVPNLPAATVVEVKIALTCHLGCRDGMRFSKKGVTLSH